ncbi:MAG TPA: hypothetical protein VEY51_17815 [Chondromyces sp.]|nr:hypothetical protein [Chondromyces sp.]
MKEISENRYCDRCEKVTIHVLREDALEIESICKECHKQEDIIKTFF